MLRKGMLAILIFLLMMTQIVVVAEDTVNQVEEETYVYIISPKVGDSGKTILNETLFISIYIKSAEDLSLELVKVPVYDFEPQVPAEDPFADFILSEEKVVMIEIESFAPVLTKTDIIGSYDQAVLALEISKVNYEAARLAYNEAEIEVVEDDQGQVDVQSMPYAERMIYTRYIQAQATLNEAMTKHNYWTDTYIQLFDQVIFQGVMMQVTEEFPYFEYTHEGILPGHYKLNVKDASGQIVEQLEFEVVTEQSIADEIINNDNFFDEILTNEILE